MTYLRDGFAFNNFAVNLLYLVSDKKILLLSYFFYSFSTKIILIFVSLLQVACEEGCTIYNVLMGGNSCKFENSMKTHFMIVARIKHIYTTDKLQLEK